MKLIEIQNILFHNYKTHLKIKTIKAVQISLYMTFKRNKDSYKKHSSFFSSLPNKVNSNLNPNWDNQYINHEQRLSNIGVGGDSLLENIELLVKKNFDIPNIYNVDDSRAEI
ncbi:hypothetical protein DMUE_3628 [Dictyocoela muelleri]|nr:hypothetical protein DMUE_3628 [Dictyocoela muelleri]